MFFRCRNCEGNVVYSPARGGMYCPHCDGIDSGEEEIKGTAECANCGAPLTTGEYDSTCRCAYCGSYIILDDRVNGRFRPDAILPFQIDREEAVEKLKQEFRNRIFTPDSFLSEATLEDMKGQYVPFWMYDYQVKVDYAGKGTKVRVWTAGNTEYTETSFYRVERAMLMEFGQVPVDASLAMQDEIMDLMEPYDYGKLQGFQEKYMSGFFGEIYNENADMLEERAKVKVEQDADMLLQDTLSGYTTLVPEHNDFLAERTAVRYSLLPVWKYVYSYQGRAYDFYVNGQTGKIVGTTPVSRRKVFAYGCTVFAAVSAALSFAMGILDALI